MPVYEFACMECEQHFEELLLTNGAGVECPACGGTRVKRQFSVFATPGSSGGSAAAASAGCACGGACTCGR